MPCSRPRDTVQLQGSQGCTAPNTSSQHRLTQPSRHHNSRPVNTCALWISERKGAHRVVTTGSPLHLARATRGLRWTGRIHARIVKGAVSLHTGFHQVSVQPLVLLPVVHALLPPVVHAMLWPSWVHPGMRFGAVIAAGSFGSFELLVP